MANQSAGVYAHGVPVTASPVHGGLVPVHGGLSPMHGMNGVEALGRGLGNSGVANLLTSSQDFSTAWGAVAGVVTVNTGGAAPDGSSTADKFVPDITNVVHNIQQAAGQGAGTYTFSVFAKSAGHPRIGFRVFDGSINFMQATLDITNGSIVSAVNGTPFIEAVGNGWYFVGVTATSANAPGTASGWQIQSLPAGVLAEQAFAGNAADGILLWQGQLAAGGPGPILFA